MVFFLTLTDFSTKTSKKGSTPERSISKVNSRDGWREFRYANNTLHAEVDSDSKYVIHVPTIDGRGLNSRMWICKGTFFTVTYKDVWQDGA